MKHLLIGLHGFGHDSNFSLYDMRTGKTCYYKFERAVGIKHYNSHSFVNWMHFELPYLGYDAKDILEICITTGPFFPWHNDDLEKTIKQMMSPINVSFLNHHQAHQYSNFREKGFVYDGQGNNNESLSIYGGDKGYLKFTERTHQSLGVIYNFQYNDFYEKGYNYLREGFWESERSQVDYAGKVMSWEAYGDHLPDWHVKNKNLHLGDIDHWLDINNMNLSSYEDKFLKNATYIKNITLKYAEELISLCKNFFTKDDYFYFSGGVAQNLILNNFLKSSFPNLEIFPHNQDDGLSLGSLYHLLKKYKINISEVKLDNFPFVQSDQDMGYASSKTIKKVAEYLAQGKIVLWCQGHGEIGPRALGHRSILMNPLVKDAKEQINKKVKKREWYRPYGASVKFDKYKKYFNLDWESPYMLYQSEVIDKEKFKSICHADGTCRIQTVYPKQETFYNLLNEFEKLTGVPVLLNTSCNLPGKPIVGFEDQVLDMFNNCHAYYLVIGDKLYERKNND